MSMPVNKGRKLMSNATKPWGAQWDYISRVQKTNVVGHWIVKDSHLTKKQLRVSWVEKTANEANLTIYYIHGKVSIRFFCWLSLFFVLIW